MIGKREVPERVQWVHDKECGCDEEDRCMVLARSWDTYDAGFRAGIEAAADVVDDTEAVTYSFGGTVHDDGPRTLSAAAKAIRALAQEPPRG